MSKVFIVDIAKCTGCYNCQLVCKDEHCGNDWMPYAKPQPMTGQFWAKVEQKTVGSIPKVKVNYTPTFCNHCKNAPCIAAAKDGAVYRREDGLVIIDPEKAAGQKQIMEACPYGAVYWNELLNIPQKCTGCAHLLDNGFTQPRCTEACPTDAMVYGKKEDLLEQLKGAEPLIEGGNIYYKNIPGEFVGGTVYDPVEKEVIIGASCVLTGEGTEYRTETDAYGDFWFRDLPKGGVYTLTISAEGFQSRTFASIVTNKSVNLDDIPLESK